MSGQARDGPEVVIGSREELLHLLAEASEIEHTLMCSYLYAGFSLKREGEAGLSPSDAEAVERWRKAIMGVAIEEMGHLLMVANLTVAVGGRPHFARPNFPIATGYFPSGVVVRLSGFSAETLDHFIFLERPVGVEEQDGETYDQRDLPSSFKTPRPWPEWRGGRQELARQSRRYEAGGTQTAGTQWKSRAKPGLRHAAAGLKESDAHSAGPHQRTKIAMAPARCPPNNCFSPSQAPPFFARSKSELSIVRYGATE